MTLAPAKHVEDTSYQVADNHLVPARVYSVRQAYVVFKMTVAELAGTHLDERAIMDHAIKTLSQGATVRLNIPARSYQGYGRQQPSRAGGFRDKVGWVCRLKPSRPM
jgi:hypothetical protein